MPASVNNTKETVAVEAPNTDAVTKTDVAADCGATGKTECSTDAGKVRHGSAAFLSVPNVDPVANKEDACPIATISS